MSGGRGVALVLPPTNIEELREPHYIFNQQGLSEIGRYAFSLPTASSSIQRAGREARHQPPARAWRDANLTRSTQC